MNSKNPNIHFRVLKFGGSSVARPENWQLIAKQAQQILGEQRSLIIVVSALAGVTDLLAENVDQIRVRANSVDVGALLGELRQRHQALVEPMDLDISALESTFELLAVDMDALSTEPENAAIQARVLATGELLASRLGEAILRQFGLDSTWLDSRDVLLCRDTGRRSLHSRYHSAECVVEPDLHWQEKLNQRGRLFIAPGFIARNEANETVLLGRGGSDTSAALIAALLNAERLEIHSDVPGLFSADPRRIPAARLLKNVSYREAQELAAMGAKALHPRALIPLKRHQIPLWLKQTGRPEMEGTKITPQIHEHGAQVKAIVQRKNITLIALEGIDMWQQVGFLADVFDIFRAHNLSVDLVSTSESNVTVTLDPGANPAEAGTLERLSDDLEKLCKVEINTDCASVSLVGLGIRTILHRLGPALEVFEQRRIFLVSQAANDLNLSFVVEARHADRLVQQLHQQIIPGGVGGDSVFGASWEQLFREDRQQSARIPWWCKQRQRLIETLGNHSSAYVYHPQSTREAAQRLKSLPAVDHVLYSMKANPHPALLNAVAESGLGIECVSLAEAQHALRVVPKLEPTDLLLTPNFAEREEYQQGLEAGLTLTIDNPWMLEHWGADFAGREVFLRLDPGSGLGHHKMVRTAGSNAKFGVPLDELERVRTLARAHNIRIIGLHAHTGSGIMHADNWHRSLEVLIDSASLLDDVRIINLGGGLGVPDRSDELPLDLIELEAGIARIKQSVNKPIEVWLEPGRYLASEAGVLLARVTQVKGKGDVRYVGLATGMNSLIRPALYGAWHEIVNLSRIDQPGAHVYNVVGPICETGDILGLDRLLPGCAPGDVMLIANTGAYGAAMASHYNLRKPAVELVLDV
ncbi:MAG: bifunctional aspartate kinase/diaminopimelate decarboxylase [Pseudomonadota bacterium]